MKPITFILLVCLCSLCPIASAEEARSITVTAMSEIKVAPDEVVIDLAISTLEAELLDAKSKNDKISAAVLALAPKHAIDEADVKVTDVDARPDYYLGGQRQQVPVAYNYTRSIEVRLTDFAKIEPFLSDAFEAGLSHVNNLNFRLKNQRQCQFEARKLAVTYAREKAEHLTELTGMKLGSPIRIEEMAEYNWDAGGYACFGSSLDGSDPFGGNPFGKNGKEIDSGKTPFRLATVQEADEEVATLTSPGVISITAEVTIEYEMTK